MKFISWNVNGLRACIQKGFLDYFNEADADFFCLQETKLSEGQLQLNLPGYHQYWCYAEKKGYSGTAIFTKHAPLSVSYGIGAPELDNEGRVITLEYGEFYLVTCYTPNAQRGLARLDHRMKWDEAFRAYLQQLDAVKPVILCGDLNIAHQEIDLKNPASNRGNAGFSDEERESFTKTLDLGFTDTFRHLHPDATGRYSWWSYMYHARENNAGWRIDYFLTSNRLQDSIHRAEIHSDILGSDHCPVSLELDTAVNGSIWSPSSQGAATVIEPEKKSKKEPKASAAPAKAFAAFFLILALLVVGVVAFGEQITDLFSPATDLGPSGNHTFAVHTYYTPLKKAGYSYGGIASSFVDRDSETFTGTSAAVTDGEQTFWTQTLDGISTANIFLRIEAGDDTLDTRPGDWWVTLEPPNQSYSEPDVLSFGYNAVPYYSDNLCQEFAGWLIWANSSSDYCQSSRVSVKHKTHNFSFSESVTLCPYLSYEQADALDTESLVLYLTQHEYLLSAVPDINSEYYFSGSVTADDLDKISSDDLYISIPALSVLADREDAYGVLMYADLPSDSARLAAYYILNEGFIHVYPTPQQHCDFIFRDFPNYPYDVVSSDIYIDAETMTTPELVNYIMLDGTISYLLMASSERETVSQLVYDRLVQTNAVIAELQTRDDAITALMDAEPIENNLITYFVLSQPFYRNQMTPRQEADLLTGQFNSYYHKFIVEDSFDSSDYLREQAMSTTQLLETMEYTSDILTQLDKCSTTESLYYVYLYRQNTYSYLREFLYREDAVALLEERAQLSDGSIYTKLISLIEYIDQQDRSDEMTTEELVRSVIENTDLHADLLYLNDYGMTIPMLSPHAVKYQYLELLELTRRDDAVDLLLNCTPPETELAPFVPAYLLGSFFTDRMTPQQEAAYLTNSYPSATKPVSTLLNTDQDVTALSTYDLVMLIEEAGIDLYSALLSASTEETQQEVYLLMRPHSNLLLELETRSDAKEALTEVFNSSRSLTSPVGLLITLWDYVQSID